MGRHPRWVHRGPIGPLWTWAWEPTWFPSAGALESWLSPSTPISLSPPCGECCYFRHIPIKCFQGPSHRKLGPAPGKPGTHLQSTHQANPFLCRTDLVRKSDSGVNFLQVIQNSALRIATGSLKMASWQHLHQETKLLPICKSLTLLNIQYLARALRLEHPSHGIVRSPWGPKTIRHTLHSRIASQNPAVPHGCWNSPCLLLLWGALFPAPISGRGGGQHNAPQQYLRRRPSWRCWRRAIFPTPTERPCHSSALVSRWPCMTTFTGSAVSPPLPARSAETLTTRPALVLLSHFPHCMTSWW